MCREEGRPTFPSMLGMNEGVASVAMKQDWGMDTAPRKVGDSFMCPRKGSHCKPTGNTSSQPQRGAWPRSWGLQATEASTRGPQSRPEQCHPKVGPSQPGASAQASTALGPQKWSLRFGNQMILDSDPTSAAVRSIAFGVFITGLRQGFLICHVGAVTRVLQGCIES